MATGELFRYGTDGKWHSPGRSNLVPGGGSGGGGPYTGPFWGLAYSRVGSGMLEPTPHETRATRPVGAFRTYFSGSEQATAISRAQFDTSHGRVPWVSFSFPTDVASVVAGAADAWAVDIYNRCATVPGPMLLTFNHEGNLPTKDPATLGISYAQAHDRLYQLKGATAPNCKVGPIVTGFEVIFSTTAAHLAAMWPGAMHEDFLGCDAYANYLTCHTDGGSVNTSSNWYISTQYYTPIAQFAASKGVDWAWGETGWGNDAAAWDRTNHGGTVSWLHNAYDSAISISNSTGSECLSVCYFDANYNTTRYDLSVFTTDGGGVKTYTRAAWPLDFDPGSPSKFDVWCDILKTSPAWRANW